jgi:hypothetical protein
MTLRRVATLAALTAVLVAAPARGDATGTVVVQLLTDPTPAGVSWNYTGTGTSFALGQGVTKHSLGSLTAGTYTISERSPDPNRPATLTGITCADTSGDSKGTIANATATIHLAAGETVNCVFVHRALGPMPTSAALSLAQQYAPTLRLSATEHYHPIAAQDFLSRAVLKSGKPAHGVTTQPRPTLFTLPTTPAATYLDVRTAQPNQNASTYRTIEQQLEAARRPTVYWRLTRQPSTGRTAIEYWFLYLYNDFADRHEADWEGVTLFLKDGAALGLTYSQHQGRTWTAWPAAAPDNHPAVYVAAGSHANYPLPGRYRVKVCYTIRVRRCTTTPQRDNALGDGTTLTPDNYDLQQLGGTGYTGNWGSGTYLLGVGLTQDRVTDPRRRSDYSNPFTAIPPGA